MNRVMLGVALGLSIGACAQALHLPIAWALAPIAIAASMTRSRLGSQATAVVAFVAWIALVATAVITWSLVVVLMIHGESTETTLRILSFALSLLGIGLLLGRRDGMAIVVGVALLDVAGLHRTEEIRPFIISMALATMLHLARPGRRRRALAIGSVIGFAVGMAALLPPAQRAFEKAAFAAFAPKSARSGLSGDDARLGEVESLATSDRLVLRVWSDRPERLRARVYLGFTGRTWRVQRTDGGAMKTLDPLLGPNAQSALSFPGPTHALESLDPAVLAGPDVRATRIVPVDLDDGLLPAPGSLLAVRTSLKPLIDAFGVLQPLGRSGDPWVVLHRDQAQIADDRAPSPEAVVAALTVPRRIDPRLRALANELGRGTAEERIAKTTAWVRAAAKYDLDVGKFVTNDPIAEFLFVKKRGYCEYFASSLAILLRLEGVPARFVTGFSVGQDNKVGEHYEVRDSDAHAWVEAYVEGRGWVTADATPAAEYLALHPHVVSRADRLRAWLADGWLSLRHGGRKGVLRALGYGAFAAFFAFGVVIVVRDIRARRSKKSEEKLGVRDPLPRSVAECVAAIDRTFAELGKPRPPAIGLLEHARALEESALFDPERARTLHAAIDLVHRAAFAGEVVEESTFISVQSALRFRSGERASSP